MVVIANLNALVAALIELPIGGKLIFGDILHDAYSAHLNPYIHGSFTEPMPHGCGQICPQDLWVKLPTPVRDGCQTLRSVGGIISGRERGLQ